MIYLDNSATTKPHPDVINSFNHVSTKFFANPSSIHQLGGKGEQLLLTAKKQAAELLNVSADEIIFTSGGTEGNNLAIKGAAIQHRERGQHIITTAIEHSSVYEACKSLEELGFKVTYLPVNEDGVISVNDLKAAVCDETILVSVMHVNNEIGSIQPIEEIGQFLKQFPKILFHVDDVQGFGKIPLSIRKNHIDLCTISAHKIHGLKGNGILYKNSRVTLFPLFHGGSQENSVRPGTENLPGAVAMTKAMRLIEERRQAEFQKLADLNQILRHGLMDIQGVDINSSTQAAPHIMNISVPGLKPEVIIHALEKEDIYISTKSACSSKQMEESRVLKACGKSKDHASSALRISLSYDQTKENIETFLHVFERTVKQFKEMMR
ncbi:cysteine desulfurase [Cerasibacillus quisquiliarum]|uniref:Aminotransferase V n=1 Tax=Cerasibacillus quisquiliarum TaxID=227865 RepID=A0A511V2X8_9BACI|nr:cysteine desulfurase family protein [Cerasibacillus quisquiliarum]MBB5147372.1 cysteine desulfurase [Cerasibacillus quisquiliarum]GEN32268.1 aminotransferase V [Cerasibacillus quisquiliarum]